MSVGTINTEYLVPWLSKHAFRAEIQHNPYSHDYVVQQPRPSEAETNTLRHGSTISERFTSSAYKSKASSLPFA